MEKKKKNWKEKKKDNSPINRNLNDEYSTICWKELNLQ